MVMVTWKDFKKEEWEIIFDIIEYIEVVDWVKYLTYVNMNDLKPFGDGKRWIDCITHNPDKTLVRTLLGERALEEYLYIQRMIRAKRWILDR